MNIVTFINAVYAISILGLLALATIIALSKNPNKNRYFIIYTYFSSFWLLSQFAAQIFHENVQLSLYLIRLTSVASVFVATSFLIFIRRYLNKKASPLLFLLPVLFSPLLLTNFGVNEVEVTQLGIAVISAGAGYMAAIAYAAISLVYGFVQFLVYYMESPEEIKRRNKYFIVGIFQAIIFIVGSSIFFAENQAAQVIIPISVFTLVLCIFFSIVRYQLFDIKTIVVRSFVYTITTTVLVAMYSGISLPIKNFLISVNTESYVSTLVEIVLLGIFGMSFYPLKLYFDKVTTKYFFRDHYNPQEVLKNINSVISGSVDLNKMLRRVGGMIKDTLLIDHCTFIIMEVDATEHIRYINLGKSVENVVLPEELDKLFRHRNVVVADQLGDSSRDLELKSSLLGQDIAVVVKLKGVNEQGHVEDQGYIVLGSKKSGKGFSGQDEKMLEILSGQLAVAVQNLVHLDEIVHFNIKLQDEVRDATKELKVKNKKLQELDETKDEFVSMASHQLRTPLTSVKGYLSMVLEGDAGELKPAQKDLLEQAFTSTQRMVYLIADLLNLSRLKTGKFVITPQSTSLAYMIESEIHQVQETAKTKDLEVSFTCDPSIPNLMLDDMKTRQVIMNFIDNAIYYTPGGGHIKVILEKSGGKAIFKVEDDGIGVSKLDQKELFGKFFRAGNAKARRPDGTGLGLYMAKMIIDAQGGEIIFESEEGKGSTFGFKFDISKLEAKI